MGKQSARIYFQGKDHKDIYYKGHYHDKMYIGSQLVWEKLKSISTKWEVFVGNITPRAIVVRSNGNKLCLIDDINHSIHTSVDGKEWNAINNPFTNGYLLSESLNSDSNGFIASKRYSYNQKNDYQPAISDDGNAWEPVNEIILYYKDGSYKKYATDGSTDYIISSRYDNDRENGKFVVLNGGGYGDNVNAVSEVKIKTEDGKYEGYRVVGLKHINGHYYFLSRTNSSYVGLWKTGDFNTFEMVFIVKNQVPDFEHTSIITEYAGNIYVIYATLESAKPIVTYKSSNGSTFEECDFLYEEGENTRWLDFVLGNEKILVHAYVDRIFVNETEFLISDIYESSLKLYTPHVNIMNEKIYVTYTCNYGENPIITFIGTVEE